jgi:hypothetical protein
MMRRADPRDADQETARIGPVIGDELADIVRRQCRIGEQHHLRVGHLGDRREIPDHVEGDALVQPFDQHRGDIHQQDGVAVGRGPCHGLNADHPAAAGPILNDDLLLQLLAELFAQQPRDGVDAAAGCERHDQRDRP